MNTQENTFESTGSSNDQSPEEKTLLGRTPEEYGKLIDAEFEKLDAQEEEYKNNLMSLGGAEDAEKIWNGLTEGEKNKLGGEISQYAIELKRAKDTRAYGLSFLNPAKTYEHARESGSDTFDAAFDSVSYFILSPFLALAAQYEYIRKRKSIFAKANKQQ